MRIEVLYFAAARERAGTDHETLQIDRPTLEALSQEIVVRHPALEPLLPRLRFAVNRAFVKSEHALQEGDEVALIPPVAGGSGRYAILDQKLSLDAVVKAVEASARGGIVTFTGTVRDVSRGKKVRRLEYEAYRQMALEKLEEIGRETEEKWPGTRVAIHHRLGVLPVGEAAVVIAVSAPHRKEAFRACEHAIDRLKEDVPIWKKEVFEDGEEWVGLGP